MKNVFITGVSGLLGTNLAHHMLKQGYKVIGLVRSKRSYKGNYHPNLELVEGELFYDFLSLFKQVDCVIHIAAITDQNIPRYDKYHQINYEACKQLFLAAKLAKVKHFVFVSTANTMGNGSIEDPGKENHVAKFPFTESFYAKSKLNAENYLLKNQEGIKLSIINPTFMLGAYDSKPSSGKIILRALKKSIIFYPPGGKNFVHVDDVCQAIIKSMFAKDSGQRYLIGNENLSYKDFYKKLNDLFGQKSLLIRIPKNILDTMGHIGNLLRYMGLFTPLSSINMKMLYADNYYSNEKSITDLDLVYQPIDKGISEAIAYFKEENYY